MTVGVRLAEERKRLGFSQGDFARKAGVSISTQKRYEIDEREAGTGYLEGIRKFGVDVTYVLTGSRRGGASSGLDSDHLAEFGLAVIKYLGVPPSDISEIARDAEKATKAEFYDKAESPDARKEIEDHIAAFEEYFFVHASALLRQRISEFSAQGGVADQALLTASIEQVEQAIKRAGKTFQSTKRAHLIAMAYKLARRTGGMDSDIADDVVSIAEP